MWTSRLDLDQLASACMTSALGSRWASAWSVDRVKDRALRSNRTESRDGTACTPHSMKNGPQTATGSRSAHTYYYCALLRMLSLLIYDR